MAKIKQNLIGEKHQALHKRTCQGGRVAKTSTMGKDQKRSFKKYRRQGK